MKTIIDLITKCDKFLGNKLIGDLYLKVFSGFFQNWIEANCQPQIKAVAAQVYDDFKCFKVVC
jgi:hypothetical protein